MANVIACRLGVYGPLKERAWTHLPEIGIRHIEVTAPASQEETTALAKRLGDHGLTASSLQGTCDVTREDVVDVVTRELDACQTLGTQRLFVSVKAGETDRTLVWDRLRRVGDAAARRNVIVVMETHPDLVTNGQLGRQTMLAVNHPNIRVNFDTANVYYYNEGVTTMGELAKVIDFVAAVHIKDTFGKFKNADFPPLGDGIVDFPAVFRAMEDRHFTGPYTMELEGGLMTNLDEPARLAFIARSVDYLRKIGALTE